MTGEDPTHTDAGAPPEDPVQTAREEVITAMARSAELYGLNRSYGRLFGILYFADDPVSLDELVAESGYAKSTVSTAMQKMARLHLVHRRSMPGEGKKAFYEAERDLWHLVQEVLKHEVQREIDIMTRALDDAESHLEAVDSPRADADLERVRSLQSMYHRFDQLTAVLTSSSLDRLIALLDQVRSSRDSD
ncbi:MAG: GbsR/MarR family transcriptional regulator [Halobacteriaceae archaeon]